MVLRNSVSKRVIRGQLDEVIANIKKFDENFRLVPITEPKVPGFSALVNVLDNDGSSDEHPADFFAFVSERYTLLPSWTTLHDLRLALEEKEKDLDLPNAASFTAEAIVHRHISVNIARNDPETGPAAVFSYINSYDKKLREEVVFTPLLLKMRYVHRRSGTAKAGFDILLSYFYDNGMFKEAVENLKKARLDRSLLKKMLKDISIPMPMALRHLFNVDGEELGKSADVEGLFLKCYEARYGYNVLSLVHFTHDMYHLFVQKKSFDRATVLLSRMSSYVSTFYNKAVGAIGLI